MARDQRDEGKRAGGVDDAEARVENRLPYEPPRIEKKRSVLRATLFSAGGTTATGLTADG